MNESLRIEDELHRAFFGGPWHGPSLKEVLAGVDADSAGRRPLAGAHSIWELAHHLHAWIAEADAVVRGKTYASLKGEKDWPPVTETSQAGWEQALASLEQAEESLEAAVREFPEDKLGEGDRSYYYLLHGIAQHNGYHAGQIALLKKVAL
jgi:DinB superfamily